MVKPTEKDIVIPFIGKAINKKRFNDIACHNRGNSYLICNADYIGKPQYIDMFGITDRLKEMWEYSGVEFCLFLTLDNCTITKCHIDKIRYGGIGHGRPVTHVLSVSQQELRVARRILQYITD